MCSRYKFSIIMAIYNVQDYIDEAMESLINQQRLDFEKDIQVIMINDGSEDESEAVCQKYKEKYPNNIIYVEKENGGVSSARNIGIEMAEGKYVNFLDSDDRISIDGLTKVYTFFEENYEYIDVVAIPMYFFEAKSGNHILNYKFKRNRIVNIIDQYSFIQLSTSSAFIKRTAIKDRRFNEKLNHLEDAELITKIIMDKLCYGVFKGSRYWCRKRANNSSATQNSIKSKEWYINTLNQFHLGIISYAKEKLGYVPKYIQYLVMYDLQWRISTSNEINIVLTLEEKEEYVRLIGEILQYIDDNIILNSFKKLNINIRLFMMSKKYLSSVNNNQVIKPIYTKDTIKLYIKDLLIFNIKNLPVNIDFIFIKNNVLEVEGHIFNVLNNKDISIVAEINSSLYDVEYLNIESKSVAFLGETIRNCERFKLKLKIDENIKQYNIRFHIKLDNNKLVCLKPSFGKFTKLANNLSKTYYKFENHLITKSGNSVVLLRNSKKVLIGREYRFIQQLFKRKQYKAILGRCAYYAFKPFVKKDIWIFSDRIDKADDNAEHLFKYAVNQNDKINKCFIIDKNSPDYERIKAFGKVIPHNSYKAKLIYLYSKKVVSSHDDWMINVFGGQEVYYRNLMNNDFVFLQHGITKDDISGWMNRYSKNVKLFITAGKEEYKSILEGNYFYNKNEVKLLGFPRYDNLIDKRKKQIVIIPTWRNGLVNRLDTRTGKRPYNDKFKTTEYCIKYKELLNDDKLLNLAKEYNYEIVFFPHPNIYQQMDDFNINEYVKVLPYNTSYQKLFNESSLLITDYSSVAFDFSYLKKPIVYYHFDKEQFFLGQIYNQGYFDYESMGFGEVCVEHNELIGVISKYIKSDCKMEDKYRKRVGEFYAFTDKNNCKRVYDEIKNIIN